MKIAVVGAGAIGAYVGAALARGGADVHLIARGEHLAAMRRDGVTVRSPRGDFRAHPRATADPEEIGPVDIVFLGLKAYSYAGAGPLLRPLLRPGTGVTVGLQAEEYDVGRPDLRGIGRRVGVGAEVAARTADGDAAAPHGRQVLAAREQVDVRAAAGEGRADVRADRAGADDRDLH